CGAVAQVARVGYDAQVQLRLLLLKGSQDLAGAVLRAIVGDDELEIVCQIRENISDVADTALDDCFFVERRQDCRNTCVRTCFIDGNGCMGHAQLPTRGWAKCRGTM